MAKVLKKEFFNRDTATVAQELLGKFLVRKIGRKEFAAMVTETEAYDGPHDLASHAFKGKTKRTEIMFGQPGNFYVYLVYGMHYMLNAVTREKDYPAAVLIRGVENFNGPGKVAKFFKIDKSFNGKIAGEATGLWFEDRGVKIPKANIQKMPRVGVAYAGPVWSAKKLRFLLT
ncbi:MAG: 3-methyladenine DNA glycosylase [Candidatus Staskawiczbacteria bacterium RIFCSPHIGHO2_12_FULL_38_11]|uniref:Putative 3-methyladenine DNA glycosylase n=1 Tax=Candidatus Staskawiczbacteria bacterium RIFCSPHIGHO2_12_FULL_38_11 TaxID=1802209 RepID=A0A1G2I7E4_9BACT|nr:MAG: 3-methyladenine DNA glycosylase [Candidatus Staskawiczbacteria bacterium RIFCSPHIGHO2_12_FULL_38_11]